MDRDPRLPRPRRIGVDWPRIARLCALGAVVMLLWLLAPTARCAWRAFEDRPIAELREDDLSSSDVDAERVRQGKGFVGGWLASVEGCYRRTPVLGQERWKSRVLGGLAGAALIAWLLGSLAAARRPTGYA